MTYPTANLAINNHIKLVPRDGVYAVDCQVQSERYRGMANIGTKPTFGGLNKTLEIHLIGFTGDIYGERMKVDFLKRLRDEKKFDSESELIQQITKDKQKSMKL